MHDYLSEVTARWLLMELARTTLLVAVLGVATWLVLRLARVSSPTLHRVCCVMVLLAGWTFVRWPVDVAWYEAPPAVVAVVAAEAVEEPESFTPPIDPALLSPPPEFGAGKAAPALAAPEVEAAIAEPLPALRPEPMPAVAPQPAWRIAWEQVLVAVWLIGIVAVVGWWLVGYLRFLWQMPRGLEGEPEWQAEFAAACVEQGRARRVEFRVTESAGPLLCRLPRRTVLLVPRSLWSALDAVERRAILRHELEHLSRGDLWKSLAVRVLALPHWFNPVAWLAVRRFDDAAEWACDRAAMDEQPTAYAAMLLRLGELAGTRARFGSAMSNRPLTTRIRRLLTLNGTEDSAMKKACLISLLLLVVPLAVVRVNLVAEEPEAKPEENSSQGIEFFIGNAETLQQEAVDVPAPAAAGELAPAAGEPEQPPAAEPADTPVKAAQRKMVEFARKTYEANDAAYKAGTITLDQVFHWSTLWLTAELAIADSREDQIAAAQRNLARLKVIEANIRRLFEQQARGGEHNAMSAANYHVADAERRLAEIEAMPEPQAKAEQPAGNREMIEAAKRAYEGTKAGYEARTYTLEAHLPWSARWLAAELAVAQSREEQLVAARAHVDRMQRLRDRIAKFNKTRSLGGDEAQLRVVDYHLADAKQRLAEIEGMPEPVGKHVANAERPLAEIEAMPEPQAEAEQPAGNREMVDAAKRAFDATKFAYESGKTTLEPLIAWSFRWLSAELAVAPSREEQLKAAQSNVERIRKIHTAIAAMFQTGGGNAQEMETAKYYLADANQRLAEIEGLSQMSRNAANHRQPRTPQQISADERQQLLDPGGPNVSPPAGQPTLSVPLVPRSSSTPYAPFTAAPQTRPGDPTPTPKYVFNPYSSKSLESTPSVAPTTTKAVPTTGNTYRRSREFREGMPTLIEKVELHYDGKMFGQWRMQLQTDLSPVLRKEAMYAMAEFASHGYGKEAAEVIFETANNYPATRTQNTFENEVQTAAVYAAQRVPAADLLPLIAKQLESDNANERLFAIQVVPLDPPAPGVAELLEKAMDDSDPRVAREARALLSRADWANAKLDGWIREALAKGDELAIADATKLVLDNDWKTPLGREFYKQPYKEKLPEVITLLHHAEPRVRERTKSGLNNWRSHEWLFKALQEYVNRGGPDSQEVSELTGIPNSSAPIDRRR